MRRNGYYSLENNVKYDLKFNIHNEYKYGKNITNIIEEIGVKIKNPIRRNIVKNALKNYWENNPQDKMNWENYSNYCIKISGLQNDIYDNYSSHIRCSGFSIRDFSQLLLHSNNDLYKNVVFNKTQVPETKLDNIKTRDISYYINKFDKLVEECYITNPVIKKFSCIYYTLRHFEELSLLLLLQDLIRNEIYNDFKYKNTNSNKIDTLYNEEIIDKYIKIIEKTKDAQFFFVQQHELYNIFKMKEIQPYMREIVRNNIKKILNSSKSDKN